eukprot:584247-Rhodomonas_salina.1
MLRIVVFCSEAWQTAILVSENGSVAAVNGGITWTWVRVVTGAPRVVTVLGGQPRLVYKGLYVLGL